VRVALYVRVWRSMHVCVCVCMYGCMWRSIPAGGAEPEFHEPQPPDQFFQLWILALVCVVENGKKT
jgi:hypothetical protein